MSTRSTANIPANVNVIRHVGGHVNDEHAKPSGPAPFAQKASTGNAIEIWSDGAVWDTVANKFLTTNDLIRNG
jgi:hypothetical protein